MPQNCRSPAGSGAVGPGWKCSSGSSTGSGERQDGGGSTGSPGGFVPPSNRKCWGRGRGAGGGDEGAGGATTGAGEGVGRGGRCRRAAAATGRGAVGGGAAVGEPLVGEPLGAARGCLGGRKRRGATRVGRPRAAVRLVRHIVPVRDDVGELGVDVLVRHGYRVTRSMKSALSAKILGASLSSVATW